MKKNFYLSFFFAIWVSIFEYGPKKKDKATHRFGQQDKRKFYVWIVFSYRQYILIETELILILHIYNFCP